MRESRASSEGWQRRRDWRWWKEWVGKEDEEMRGETRGVGTQAQGGGGLLVELMSRFLKMLII
jgi:hypothetical protein